MPVAVERQKGRSLIRITGEATVTCVAELKSILLDALAMKQDLQLDLQGVEEIDIPVLQLLWAAAREAECSGVRIAVDSSAAVDQAARDAGFAGFPGRTSQGGQCPR